MSVPRNKRLIWANGASHAVAVYQDGSDTYPQATYQYDDAFGEGFLDAPTVAARAAVHVESLKNEMGNGATMVVKFRGGLRHWMTQGGGAPLVNPNDEVDFWADPLHRDRDVDVPGWHLNNATVNGESNSRGGLIPPEPPETDPPGAGGTPPVETRVRLFKGWVETHTVDAANGDITVVVRDGAWKADDIRIVRNFKEGIRIPGISFNPEPDSSNVVIGVKVTAQQPLTIGHGYPDNATGDQWYATLGQLLGYLGETFGGELFNLGLVSSGLAVFDSGDLAQLTIKPLETTYGDIGFTSIVRDLLRRWAPDFQLHWDSRALQFRIYRALKTHTDQHANAGSGSAHGPFPNPVTQPGLGRVNVADNHGIFSDEPGADGQRIRIVHRSEFYGLREFEAYILRQNFGLLYVRDAMPFLPPVGTDVYPLRGETMDTVTLNADDVADSNLQIVGDTVGLVTAVNLVSTNQKTEPFTVSLGNGMSIGWDTDMEEGFKDADYNRSSDSGHGGDGIPVYKAVPDTTGANIKVYLAHAALTLGEDHLTNEWAGASLVLMTSGNSPSPQHPSTPVSYTVVGNANVADMGDGRPGMAVELDTVRLPTGFITEVTATGAEVADDVMLTDDLWHSTTQSNNKRSRVYAEFRVITTAINQQTHAMHSFTCARPRFHIDNGSGQSRNEIGTPVSGPTPVLNPGAYGQAAQYAGGGIGSFQVWSTTYRIPRPASYGCGPTLRAPISVTSTFERTTTDIRSVRYPINGHEGWAAATLGLVREKTISIPGWISDAQNARFENLAEALWNAYQGPHASGGVSKLGIQEHGVWLDLAARASYSTEMAPAGAPNRLTSFWAPMQSVELDFTSDQVKIGFDTAAPLPSIESGLEDVYRGKSDAEQRAEELRSLRQLVECHGNANRSSPSPGQCTSSLSHGGRPAHLPIGEEVTKNLIPGVMSVSMAGSGGGRGGGSTGARADRSILRDTLGGYFQVLGGGIAGGTVTAGVFTESHTADPVPHSLVREALEAAGAALAAMGLTLVAQREPVPTRIASTAAGGGSPATTVFTTEHAGWTVDDLIGGVVHPNDFDDANPRPEYIITDNDASTVTVAAISEADPPDNCPCVVYFKPAPVPNATDFPTGGIVATDVNGDYVVVDPAGVISPGTLDATNNEIDLTTGDRTISMPLAAGGETIHVDVPSFLNTSAGAGDAGRAVKLDASGLIDATMLTSVPDSAVDHNLTTNYDITEHRVINDAGTSATELWSASKIATEAALLSLTDGTRAFSGEVAGVTPTADASLTTKLYVDDSVGAIETDVTGDVVADLLTGVSTIADTALLPRHISGTLYDELASRYENEPVTLTGPITSVDSATVITDGAVRPEHVSQAFRDELADRYENEPVTLTGPVTAENGLTSIGRVIRPQHITGDLYDDLESRYGNEEVTLTGDVTSVDSETMIADRAVLGRHVSDDAIAYLCPRVARRQSVSVYVGKNLAATTTGFVFVAPVACTFIGAHIVVQTTTVSDGSNYWQIKLTNATTTNDITVVHDTNVDNDLTANTAQALTADGQYASLAADDVVTYTVTETGTATSLDLPLVVFTYLAADDL